jgi:hypothetical protein
MVEVNERLIVAPSASGDPLFSLTFVGVVGQQVGSTEYTHWQLTYQRYASLFHEHGSFRVRDAAAATSNYSILNFGQCVRANRVAYRAVILPHRLDKSIWLIDVDAITGLVLYSAEYDPSARLLGELEVTQLLSAQSVGRLPANWQWRPLSVVTAYPDIDHAIAYLADPGLVRPRISDIAGEYSQSRVQVTESPLNLVRSLVVTFTDGIDEFFVIETPGQSNPLDLSPSSVKGKKTSPSHTIAFYDDPSLRVYLFGEGSVMFEMVGHGAMLRLGQAAKRVYTQAITHT